jgi:predicted acyltransferase
VPLRQPPSSADLQAARVVSVDALRGLTILLMIFVNDIAGAAAAPRWLKHIEPSDADGMTLADVVFPAFLFITGVSIPLAFQRALEAGRSIGSILAHVLVRTASLLAIGVLMVNASSEATGWPRGLWEMSAYVAVLLAWNRVPSAAGTTTRILIWIGRVAGGIAVAVLAWQFRTAEGRWLQPQWWGILGLIGWAYCVTAIVYLLVRGRREFLVGAVGLLTAVFLGARAGFFNRVPEKAWLAPWTAVLSRFEEALASVDAWVDIGSMLGSLASVTAAGAALGTILLPTSGIAEASGRRRWALVFGFGLACGAVLLDPLYGINKIAATPSWCLWSSAFTCWTWALLSWLIDDRRWSVWTWPLRAAGENALTAFLLHPIVLHALSLTGTAKYLHFGEGPGPAIARSAAMAIAVLILTGLLKRAHLHPRL